MHWVAAETICTWGEITGIASHIQLKMTCQVARTLCGHTAGRDIDFEVACSNRGGATQIYHLSLLKLWREVHPVSLVTAVIPEGELRPEVTENLCCCIRMCVYAFV